MRCISFLFVLPLVAGCPGSTTVIHTCAEATIEDRGAACDFVGTCGEGCAPMFSCMGGVVSVAIARCDAGVLDAGGPDGVVVRSCAEAVGQPDGVACDFTESCMTDCRVSHRTCLGGVLGTASSECPDAGPDGAMLDAFVCMPPFASDDCRDDGDCTGAMTCLRPGESLGCGACMVPVELCTASTDCSGTDVCVFFTPPCSCGGDASECRPTCVTAGCAPDETCDAGSGLCAPTHCSAGYTCPSHTQCMESKSQDEHGCVRDSCTADADCGCGACVEGLCYDDFGACTFLPD